MAAAALMVLAAVMIMITLLDPTGCDTFTSFDPLLIDISRAGKYMVGEQDMESEFLMESHISRILLSSADKLVTPSTSDSHKPANGGCERPEQRYQNCLGEKRDNPPSENCSTFNRGNPGCG